jgi:hypothetical protein
MGAVPSFLSSLMSYFPGMLFGYFLNDCQIVPLATITAGIAFIITLLLLLLLLLLLVVYGRGPRFPHRPVVTHPKCCHLH